MSAENHNTKKVIFLGTGTSQGIPIIGCTCDVCTSKDSFDKRLRTSAILQINEYNILFDAGADFRQQLLACGIDKIDAVLFTHEHRDHTGGLDELRPITWFQKKSIPIYAENRVLEYLKLAFPHILGEEKYPGGAKILPISIDETPFSLENKTKIIPIRVRHFKELPILGFRIDDFAYITDCKTIDTSNIEKLKGLKTLVINALGKKIHPSHFCLDEALALIKTVNPDKAYLTHVGHDMGLHKSVEKELPKSVHLAYDGLTIEC